jgi:hypothetical protein
MESLFIKLINMKINTYNVQYSVTVNPDVG